MITIIIGTRTQSALRAAIDMAMQDGRRFDVVYRSGWRNSIREQLGAGVPIRAAGAH